RCRATGLHRLRQWRRSSRGRLALMREAGRLMAPPPGNFSLRIGRASLAGALSDQQRNGRMATQRNAAERDAAEAVHAPALLSSCPAVAAGFGRILIAALSAVLFLGVLAGQLRAQTGEAA